MLLKDAERTAGVLLAGDRQPQGGTSPLAGVLPGGADDLGRDVLGAKDSLKLEEGLVSGPGDDDRLTHDGESIDAPVLAGVGVPQGAGLRRTQSQGEEAGSPRVPPAEFPAAQPLRPAISSRL